MPGIAKRLYAHTLKFQDQVQVPGGDPSEAVPQITEGYALGALLHIERSDDDSQGIRRVCLLKGEMVPA